MNKRGYRREIPLFTCEQSIYVRSCGSEMGSRKNIFRV